MKHKSLFLLLMILMGSVQAASHPVGWTPLLGVINIKPSNAKDFQRVVSQDWQYTIRVNFILRGVDYDLDHPEFTTRTIGSCRELLELDRLAILFTGQKNVFDELPQSEVKRYVSTCKAYQRTVKMQASKQRSSISAKQLAEFLIKDFIQPGDKTFLDSMAKTKSVTEVIESHAVVLSEDKSIYIIRKVSWGDMDADGYEDINFVIVHSDGKKGDAIGITVTRNASGRIVMKEAW